MPVTTIKRLTAVDENVKFKTGKICLAWPYLIHKVASKG
jgi:hypothetical protein